MSAYDAFIGRVYRDFYYALQRAAKSWVGVGVLGGSFDLSFVSMFVSLSPLRSQSIND